MNSSESILPLKSHLVEKIWGGNRIGQIKGISGQFGESWEVSTLDAGPSMVRKDTLANYLGGELNFLIKFIDTSDELSVQVHPNDQWAEQLENSKGKTECWIILDAKPGAGIYLGLNEKTTKENFARTVHEGGDLTTFLNFIPVNAGDFFYVPAGTIHAIGKDIFLAEIQQSSGITYRVWDWNRVDEDGKSRQLHIDKAMQVADFSRKGNEIENFKIKKNILQHSFAPLIAHRDFNVEVHSLDAGEEVNIDQIGGDRLAIVSLGIEGRVQNSGGCVEVEKYSSLYLMKSASKNNKFIASKKGTFISVY